MGDEDEVPQAALAAGGVSRSRRFGARRSPTTGHRIRRPQTPEPGLQIQNGKEKVKVKRSLSSPGELHPHISATSSSEEEISREIKKPNEDNITAHIDKLEQKEKDKKENENTKPVEAKVPKPIVRKRVKSLPKSIEEKISSDPSSEENKENSGSLSWWKSWQNWGGQSRGKSLERDPGTEPAPKAIPRRRNRSLTRPERPKKRNASLSLERIKVKEERKPSPSQTPKNMTSKERRMMLTKEKNSFDDSSDEFWKPNSLESTIRRLECEMKEISQENRPQKTPKKYLKSTSIDKTGEDLSLRQEWNIFLTENENQVRKIRLKWNKCASELLLLMIYCGLGGLMFRSIEGAFESFYKCGVKRVKRDFIESLWSSSHNLREEEWKSLARRKLMTFEEQLFEAFEAGSTSYSGQRSWSFLNSVLYCLTVVTTIGQSKINFF